MQFNYNNLDWIRVCGTTITVTFVGDLIIHVFTVFVGDDEEQDAVVSRQSHGPPRVVFSICYKAHGGGRVSSPVDSATRGALGQTRIGSPLGRRVCRLTEGEVHAGH